MRVLLIIVICLCLTSCAGRAYKFTFKDKNGITKEVLQADKGVEAEFGSGGKIKNPVFEWPEFQQQAVQNLLD